MTNNEMMFTEQSMSSVQTSKTSLDKKGLTILITSLILALVFIFIGTIILIAPALEDSSSNNSGNSKPSTVETVYSGSTKYIYKTGYVEYEFTPTSTKSYSLYFDDCEIVSITDEYGDDVRYNEYSSYTSAYLYSYTTYTIRIYSNYSGSSFYIN